MRFLLCALGSNKWLIQHLTIDGNSDEFVRRFQENLFDPK
jgi:hypothetical protein